MNKYQSVLADITKKELKCSWYAKRQGFKKARKSMKKHLEDLTYREMLTFKALY